MKTYFVTLNWNTTDYFKQLYKSVEACTPESHTWVVLDNGSDRIEVENMMRFWGDSYSETSQNSDLVLIREMKNIGCVMGHNKAFDKCRGLAMGEPFEIVMMDTDVEVTHNGWLTEVREWIGYKKDDGVEIGIVGLEHSPSETCAGAVFLDRHGNWYLHPGQTYTPTPVRAESVGLGMALLRWPVVKNLRFDTGFKVYYKQDDDLCFQVRANLGMQVWAYPIEMTHWGSRGLVKNKYTVEEAKGRTEFEELKRKNQHYFAQKWSWALRNRRKNLAAETAHLDEIANIMRDRRHDAGLTQC